MYLALGCGVEGGVGGGGVRVAGVGFAWTVACVMLNELNGWKLSSAVSFPCS